MYHVMYHNDATATWINEGQSATWGDAYAYARILRRTYAKVKIVEAGTGVEWAISPGGK